MMIDEETDYSINLRISKGVFGSDLIGTPKHLARYLYKNPHLYRGKFAADIGCGPGTQGIIMLKYGASSVLFSDISPKAVANTKKNIEDYANADVYESDLFTDLPNILYDVIVFNHPFFASSPERFTNDPNYDEMLRRGMLGGTELLQRFLRKSPDYLRKEGIIIMPYFHFAGEVLQRR